MPTSRSTPLTLPYNSHPADFKHGIIVCSSVFVCAVRGHIYTCMQVFVGPDPRVGVLCLCMHDWANVFPFVQGIAPVVSAVSVNRLVHTRVHVRYEEQPPNSQLCVASKFTRRTFTLNKIKGGFGGCADMNRGTAGGLLWIVPAGVGPPFGTVNRCTLASWLQENNHRLFLLLQNSYLGLHLFFDASFF